jgi:hypothetical protein
MLQPMVYAPSKNKATIERNTLPLHVIKGIVVKDSLVL